MTSVVPVPSVFSDKSLDIAELPFYVNLSPIEANLPDRMDIIKRKLNTMAGRNYTCGKIAKILSFDVLEISVIASELSGECSAKIAAKCAISRANPGGIIYAAPILKITEGKGMHLEKKNQAIIAIQAAHLPDSFHTLYKVGQKIDVEILEARQNLAANHAKIIGKPAKMLYDIPAKMRYIVVEPSGIAEESFNLQVYDGKNPEFCPHLIGDRPEFFEKLAATVQEKPDLKWDSLYKFMLNPYELLGGSRRYLGRIGISAAPIHAKYGTRDQPVSRAYYKAIEMPGIFGIKEIAGKYAMSLGDAPGGFAQAFTHIYRGKVVTTSLNPKGRKGVIAYSPKIIKNSRITIDYMQAGDGDLTNIGNIRGIIKKYTGKCFVVGCDGAFQHDLYPGVEKEIQHNQLLLSEIFAALGVLCPQGSCFFKLYTVMSPKTALILQFLAGHFKKVYWYKPRTTRISNTETFIVCRKFRGISPAYLDSLIGGLSAISAQGFAYGSFIQHYFGGKVSENLRRSIGRFNGYLTEYRKFVYDTVITLESGEIRRPLEKYREEQEVFAAALLD